MITTGTFGLSLALDLKKETSLDEAVWDTFLHIEPIIPYALYSPEITEHVEVIKGLLKKCLSKEFFQYDLSSIQSELLSKLPLIFWDQSKTAPGCVSCIILCMAPKEEVLENKIESILKSWITPGKHTKLLTQLSLCFKWDLFPNISFFIMEAKGLIESEKDLENITIHLPSFTKQLISGLRQPESLKNLFSSKPLLQEYKQAEIHQELSLLLERFPRLFSVEIFSDMSRFLSLCEKSFFEPRSPHLITKIISFHHLMKFNLTRWLSLQPERRHVKICCIRTDLHFYFGSKQVLGLIIAISPLDKHELFEESHIAQAVQFLLPHVTTVKNSFYSYQKLNDPICSLYIEIEKKDGSVLTTDELTILKKGLADELKRRIEKLVPTIFMARNEEEVMRNILILSQELKYISDIPQVIISLESQTLSEILFTVILVRLLKSNSCPISKQFDTVNSSIQFIPDRIQQIGFLRKNYPKEANVFRLKIPKDRSLLRADYSVNFYLARNRVVSILEEAVGVFRDYNGGMILKQGELFYRFQDIFSGIADKNPELLENFFFSLSPIEAQATISLHSLKTLFHQFLKAQKANLFRKDDYFLKIEESAGELFCIIRVQEKEFKEDLLSALDAKEILSKSLISSCIQIQDCLYTCLILPSSDERKKQLFIEAIHEAIRSWIDKMQNQQVLKLSFSTLPPSLDPRLAGEKSAHIITKMLFEGLTRLDKNGEPIPALAQFIEVSSDLKKYTFKLRLCYWSDGSQITAYDFEYSWKKILSPQFFTPFAYVFYPIKNARLAKENLCSIDCVGVSSVDALTLIVELEHPTPEFLELTAHSLFSPVHHVKDKIHPNWATKSSNDFVCNGPFLLKNISNLVHYELVKNPLYWDKEHVRLQKLHLSKNPISTADEMFKKDEIHWLGTSIGSWEFFLENNPEPQAHSSYIEIYWCIFNTEKFPFNNTLLRQAFDLAINKHDLVNLIQGDYLPASTPLPLSHTLNHDPNRALGNQIKAIELFELALEELGLTRKTFPLVTINHDNTPIRKKIFTYIQEQWSSLFQIPCRLESFNFNALLAKTIRGDFSISSLHWKTWIDNPMYALEIFKYKNLHVNVAKWSHPEYVDILQQAKQTIDPLLKIKLVSDAEKILLREVPVIPLLYEKEKNIVKPYLHQVIHSKTTGHIDFKYAYIDKKNENVSILQTLK